jgi:hypothetical protein
MITILVIFVLLILFIALSKNYFIGFVNPFSSRTLKGVQNNSDTLLFTDGIKSINPDIELNNKNINNQVVKANKIINKDLCILINNKTLTYTHTNGLILKNINSVNNNNKFKFLNISGNDLVIYHPETNGYIYVNKDNKLKVGQLNILNPENNNKAKFTLIYTPIKNNFINKIIGKNNVKYLTGTYALQHIETGLYLSINNSNLVLSKNGISTKLLFYSAMKKISMVSDLINPFLDTDLKEDQKTDIEPFNTDKGNNNKNKRGLCSMVRNGLVPGSLIPCNLTDDIESFTADTTAEDINIFEPHIKMDYQKLFKSYGKNLYNDNLESINGVNIIDYLKNYNMSIINKNNDLQTFIDKESLKLEQILDTKMEDLELIKLNKDSSYYYTFNPV